MEKYFIIHGARAPNTMHRRKILRNSHPYKKIPFVNGGDIIWKE